MEQKIKNYLINELIVNTLMEILLRAFFCTVTDSRESATGPSNSDKTRRGSASTHHHRRKAQRVLRLYLAELRNPLPEGAGN